MQQGRKKGIRYPQIEACNQWEEIEEIISLWKPELRRFFFWFPYPLGDRIKLKPITPQVYFKKSGEHPEIPNIKGLLRCYYSNGFKFTLQLAKEKKIENWIPNMRAIEQQEEKEEEYISEEDYSYSSKEKISREEIEKKKNLFQKLINEEK